MTHTHDRLSPAAGETVILVVRGDARVRRSTARILERAGFQVVCGGAAFLNGAFFAFYSHALNPGWLQRAWDWEKAGLLAQQASEQEIGRHEAIANVSQTLVFQLLLEPLRTLIMGLILSTAVAAVMRRQPAEATAALRSRADR